jgi:flagellar motor switch protein FliM
MSNGNINNLTKERLQKLLSAIGTAPGQSRQTDSVPYNWREPHYFNSDQLGKIRDFTDKFTVVVGEKFSELCRDKFVSTAGSVSQLFAAGTAGQFSNNQINDYCMPFGAGPEHPFGFVGIPEQTAIVWAKQLLGDNETEEKPGRILSSLEESLLGDMADAIVTTLGKLYSGDIRTVKNMTKGQWPLNVPDTEELCKITFNVKKADAQNGTESYIVISCSRLDSIAGKNSPGEGQTQTKTAAGDNYKMIFEHIGNIPVRVTADLACADILFEDMLNLQTGDILVLDKTVNEPVTLSVENRVFGFGQLAKCSNRYAVALTETKFPNAAQNKNPAASPAKPAPAGNTIAKGKK